MGGRMFRTIRDMLADEEAGVTEYQCRCCGERFGRRRQVCPACDCFRIERAEW